MLRNKPIPLRSYGYGTCNPSRILAPRLALWRCASDSLATPCAPQETLEDHFSSHGLLASAGANCETKTNVAEPRRLKCKLPVGILLRGLPAYETPFQRNILAAPASNKRCTTHPVPARPVCRRRASKSVNYEPEESKCRQPQAAEARCDCPIQSESLNDHRLASRFLVERTFSSLLHFDGSRL